MYAIIESGGKQYKVAEGDVVKVELLPNEVNSAIELDKVIAIENEGQLSIGNPYVAGVKVSATVLEHGKGKKVVVFRYKPKKNIRKKNDHRQPFTALKIEKIMA